MVGKGEIEPWQQAVAAGLGVGVLRIRCSHKHLLEHVRQLSGPDGPTGTLAVTVANERDNLSEDASNCHEARARHDCRHKLIRVLVGTVVRGEPTRCLPKRGLSLCFD